MTTTTNIIALFQTDLQSISKLVNENLKETIGELTHDDLVMFGQIKSSDYSFFDISGFNELRDYIPENIQRILLVSEKTVAENTPAVRMVTDQLKGIDVTLFFDVEENPSIETVEKAGQLSREHNSQLVIGIGGGSPMDAGKGVAMCATTIESLSDLISMESLPADPLPVICIPTTSGTGSEVTPYAVFTDRNGKNKCGYENAKIFPSVALVDPELTFTMPESVVINTGMDVLTHSIEAFLSIKAFPLNDLLAVESIQLVLKNLKQAVRKNKEAMSWSDFDTVRVRLLRCWLTRAICAKVISDDQLGRRCQGSGRRRRPQCRTDRLGNACGSD